MSFTLKTVGTKHILYVMAADAEYGNASAGKRLHRLLAKQELRTGKFIEHGFVRLSSCAAKKSTSKS